MGILAGDIGGTSTRLAWFEPAADGLRCSAEAVFPSRLHTGLAGIVATFTAAEPRRIAAACFGIAGPIREARVETPNLPWVIEGPALARQLGLAHVELINDLEANAWGIAGLTAEDFAWLNRGVPAAGNAAVISAGTGLGEAGLYWDGCHHHPFATEGGHSDFAPRNDLEVELLRHLNRRYGRVSVERVVSGPGLVGIYEFLRARGGGVEPAALTREMAAGDPAAAISRAARDGSSQTAQRSLALFVTLYGAEAGNLALKTLATAGVYVGGGIAPKLLAALQDGSFMAAFSDKGRMRGLLEAMPVRVIVNERAALIGAARCAALRHGLM